MKHPTTLLFLLTVLLCNINRVQSQVQEIAKFQYKKGIYKSFESFRDNKPTAELTYGIETKDKNIGGDGLAIYKLKITVYEKEALGSVFGFCDGKNFYFNKDITYTSYTYFNPKSDFLRMENYGRFTTFKTFESKYSPGYSVGSPVGVGYSISIGSGKVTSRSKVDFIIDMETGVIQPINKKLTRKILSDDEELTGFYEKDEHKKTLAIDYVLWYNKKHSLYIKNGSESN